MKKYFAFLLVALAPLLALSGCGKEYDYAAHISELRSDIFKAETDDFSLTLNCVSREYPYAADGIACPRSDLVEISLVPKGTPEKEYGVSFTVGDKTQGGEMSFRNAFADFYYAESVSAFPEGSVSITVSGQKTVTITATSVKNDGTLGYEDVLKKAVEAEKERIGRMTGDVFLGEFHVRLLRRDKNYYYVGIVDRDGDTLSLLMDSETGDVLARRDTKV